MKKLILACGLMAFSLSVSAQIRTPKKSLTKGGNEIIILDLCVSDVKGKYYLYIQGKDTVVIDSAQAIRQLLEYMAKNVKKDSLRYEMNKIPHSLNFKTIAGKKKWLKLKSKL